MPLVALCGVPFGILGLIWAQASGLAGAAPVAIADRGRIEGVVHDYILAHPEILPEAMQRLQDRESADQQTRAGRFAAANRAAIARPFGSAWEGSASPDVTLVEYFDYNCGYCRASLPAIRDLLASDPRIRIVYREFPILSPESVDAARMSLAAAAQGRFKPFHDALYAAGPVTARSIAAAAQAAGIDTARARALAADANAEIAANRAVAQKLELRGTPSWVIGSKVVPYALPLEELRKAVAEARAGR